MEIFVLISYNNEHTVYNLPYSIQYIIYLVLTWHCNELRLFMVQNISPALSIYVAHLKKQQ